MENLQTQGISLPRLGLGTFRMQGDACRAAVESALGLGYRHLDTAEMYGNEEAIGEFERALAINPAAAAVRNNLGISYASLNRHEEAIASYRRAIASQPTTHSTPSCGSTLARSGQHAEVVTAGASMHTTS